MYIGDSFAPGGMDRPVAGKVGTVVNVGPPARPAGHSMGLYLPLGQIGAYRSAGLRLR